MDGGLLDALRERVRQASEAEWFADRLRQESTTGVARETQAIRLTSLTARVVWADVVDPILDTVFVYLPAGDRLGKVVLSRIPPGAKISLHTDHEPDQERLMRIHVPVLTSRGAGMRFPLISPVPEHLLVGYAWLIDSNTPHMAYNWGRTPRIHLVFDYYLRHASEVP